MATQDRRTKKMLLEDLEAADTVVGHHLRDKAALSRLVEEAEAKAEKRGRDVESLNHRLGKQVVDTRTLAMRCQHLKGVIDGMAMMVAVQAGKEPKLPDPLNIQNELECGWMVAPTKH